MWFVLPNWLLLCSFKMGNQESICKVLRRKTCVRDLNDMNLTYKLCYEVTRTHFWRIWYGDYYVKS